MENLKKKSIRIQDRIVVCWPQYDEKEEVVDMTNIRSKFNGRYATNNSTICFVDDDVFVTPYTDEAMITIRNAGLEEDRFHVPFSNMEYPIYEKAKWQHLRDLAHESYYRKYEEDCAKWCDEHHITELSEATLQRCFRMPRSGVPVKHLYYEDTYYPVNNDESCLDSVSMDKLGRYCTNNGKVVFVYRNGHTYVAKGYKIIEELDRAGYKPSGIFVPFSNGEQITDPYLATEWDRVPKK